MISAMKPKRPYTFLLRQTLLFTVLALVQMFNLNQAAEFYPDLAEIEYRLTGLYFTLNQPGEGYIHLNNALHLDKEYDFIIEELFPRIYKRKTVFEIITNFKNS